MGNWGTFELSDFLMFSPDTFDRLFVRLNMEVWPLQLATLALGTTAALLLRPSAPQWGHRVAAAILSAIWLWVAWTFHLQRFAVVNLAAPWYAVLFAAEALVLIWVGVLRGEPDVTASGPHIRRAGVALCAFGLVVYPLLNRLQGHGWARAEVFGIAPDPTAVGTLGILLMMEPKAPWPLWIGPVVWCLLSGAMLWALGAQHAFLPPMAAVLAIAAVLKKRH